MYHLETRSSGEEATGTRVQRMQRRNRNWSTSLLQRVLVTGITNDIILGLDFLHANNIFLDLGAHALIIDDERIVMSALGNLLTSCKVVVAEGGSLQGLFKTLVPEELKGMTSRGLVGV